MARRATSSTKERNTPAPEQAVAKAPRRGKKSKQHDMPADDLSVPDALFPGGDEPVDSVAASAPAEPAKARRVRKPRAIELAAEPLTTDDEPAEEASAPTLPDHAAEENDAPDIVDAPAAPSPESVATADSEAASSAARLDAETGTASFDWPVIEAVAAASGPNQAMAKLLLAARAEGANSRWPF